MVDGSARIAGLFYAALGADAIVGTVLAVLIVRKIPPLRLAAPRSGSCWPGRSSSTGVVPLFTVVVAGITWMAILFAAFAWRQGNIAVEVGEAAAA